MDKIRKRIKIIIFGTDTRSGKLFDVVLIITIILSIIVVLIDSVADYHHKYGSFLHTVEWIFTIMFTMEYFLRFYCVKRPSSYIFSFFGIIDLLAVIPTYLSMLMPGTEVLAVIRVLRVLRVFRVLKLVQYMGEADLLIKALVASRRKIYIFLFFVMNLVIILGSVMYLIEGETPGFTSIPSAIYWAIVTLTTVGYGDISPSTGIGQAIAAIIMIMGYSIIAVPTGIVGSEINYVAKQSKKRDCIICEKSGLDEDAKFCSDCGSELTD